MINTGLHGRVTRGIHIFINQNSLSPGTHINRFIDSNISYRQVQLPESACSSTYGPACTPSFGLQKNCQYNKSGLAGRFIIHVHVGMKMIPLKNYAKLISKLLSKEIDKFT